MGLLRVRLAQNQRIETHRAHPTGRLRESFLFIERKEGSYSGIYPLERAAESLSLPFVDRTR